MRGSSRSAGGRAQPIRRRFRDVRRLCTSAPTWAHGAKRAPPREARPPVEREAALRRRTRACENVASHAGLPHRARGERAQARAQAALPHVSVLQPQTLRGGRARSEHAAEPAIGGRQTARRPKAEHGPVGAANETLPIQLAQVAQLVEQRTENPRVERFDSAPGHNVATVSSAVLGPTAQGSTQVFPRSRPSRTRRDIAARVSAGLEAHLGDALKGRLGEAVAGISDDERGARFTGGLDAHRKRHLGEVDTEAITSYGNGHGSEVAGITLGGVGSSGHGRAAPGTSDETDDAGGGAMQPGSVRRIGRSLEERPAESR